MAHFLHSVLEMGRVLVLELISPVLSSIFLAKMFTMSIKCHILTLDTSTLNTQLQMENKQNKIEIFSFCSWDLPQEERGKAGGHEPPLFPLPGHILAFFSSVPLHLTLPGKTTFLNDILRAFKVWYAKIQPRHAKKHNSNYFFNST